MKKFLLQLFAILLFTACQKEISMDKASEKIAGVDENKQVKILVCHYDAATGISKTIEINANALAGHLEHGDLQGDCSTVLTTICDQDWMVKNLDVDHYRNGDPIPQVTDPSAWMGLTTGAWCYYNNDSANGAIYGKLYNWYAVNDPRRLAPVRWHVPSYNELKTLQECLGGREIAGGKMKAITLWNSPNIGATNESGFTGLPGGGRSNYFGIFSSSPYEWGYFWSSVQYKADSAQYNADEAWLGLLRNEDSYFHLSIFPKGTGLSVRCVRD